MPEVTNVRVSFGRKKQPAQYEEAAPFVEFSAAVLEGEDHVDVARGLMRDAVETVYAGIGYGVPERTAKALEGAASPAGKLEDAQAEKPEAKKSEKKTETKKSEAKKTEKKTEAADDVPEDEPKKTESKKADAGNDVPEDEPKKTESKKANDDVPDDEPKKGGGNITDSPEDRRNPEDEDEDDEEMSAEDLQTFVSRAISRGVDDDSGKKVGIDTIKEILAGFSAARIPDVKPEDRSKVVAAIREAAGT